MFGCTEINPLESLVVEKPNMVIAKNQDVILEALKWYLVNQWVTRCYYFEEMAQYISEAPSTTKCFFHGNNTKGGQCRLSRE